MIDRDRLIKAWKIFRDSNPYEICNGREFRAIKEPEYCMSQMIEDTIELLKKFGELQERHKILVEKADDMYSLLKEQEAVEPTFRQGEDGVFVWACGSCGAYMYHIYDGIDKAKQYAKYCRQCGKAVKWDDKRRSNGNHG